MASKRARDRRRMRRRFYQRNLARNRDHLAWEQREQERERKRQALGRRHKLVDGLLVLAQMGLVVFVVWYFIQDWVMALF